MVSKHLKSYQPLKEAEEYKLKTLQTQVQSLDRKDPLEKGMATHFDILAWRIPWTEEPGELQSTGLQKSDMTEQLNKNITSCCCMLSVCSND